MSGAVIQLPWNNTKAYQLTGYATAPLSGGGYNFTALGKLPMSPTFEFSNNALYVLTDFTLFATVIESAWEEALNRPLPEVQLHMTGGESAPVLNKPILFSKYFEQYAFIQMMYPRSTPNSLLFSIRGTVTQRSLLAAYASLTAGFVITLYEVRDKEFIKKYGGGLQ